MVVLNEIGVQTSTGKILAVPAFKEETTAVTEDSGFDDHEISDGGRNYFHGKVVKVGDRPLRDGKVGQNGDAAGAILPGATLFPQQPQQILPIEILLHRLRQGFQLLGTDMAIAESNFLRAGNLQALPFLDGLDEQAGFQ